METHFEKCCDIRFAYLGPLYPITYDTRLPFCVDMYFDRELECLRAVYREDMYADSDTITDIIRDLNMLCERDVTLFNK